MPTEEVSIESRLEDEPSSAARQLAREAARRMDRFLARPSAATRPAFVPSDPLAVYPALRAIRRQHLAAGERFCEWGSGFGVIACLAAEVGFQSYGIETDPELIREARRLARDARLNVVYAEGSFLPPGADRFAARLGDFAWIDLDAHSGYDELLLAPEDFDVIFAYPWPGEEEFVERVFERFAAGNALLLSYHSQGEVRLRRKRARRR